MERILKGASGVAAGLLLLVALAGAFMPRPAAQPSLTQVEAPVDEVLESVNSYVSPRLRGVGGRLVPPAQARAVAEALVHAAYRAGFDPLFIVAVVEVESRWDIDAVSSSGARGLMQLLPRTFMEVSDYYTTSDPIENVRAGVAYLAFLYKDGKGFVRPESILRAYNGGPGAAMMYNQVARTKGNLEAFPAEMRYYPGKVMACYRKLVQAAGGDYKHPEKTWRLP